jgi:hypothetical protein
MRTKILLAIAFALGIASMVLMFLEAANKNTITALLVIGFVCVTIEFIASRKSKNEDSEE